MAKDTFYIYDKETFKRIDFGEVQTDFNKSYVIDGTKDSAKIEILSFNGEEIEPWTIAKHGNTGTSMDWWVVSHDKVERFPNEGTPLYKHNLQLLGAIELLNARDLTDCGFYQNRYTINSFTQRLFELSTFEFAHNFSLTLELEFNDLDDTKVVDYIKTFENYTLLSALRELFDGYNCACKLNFIEVVRNSNYYLDTATLVVMSKTGITSRETLTESAFNGVRETKSIDKNSFGTTVISNTENVVSVKSKTYPSHGFAKLSSNANEITRDNAILRLPSNVFKVNWVKMIRPINVSIGATQIIKFEQPDLESIKQTLKKYLIKALDYGASYADIDYLLQDSILNDTSLKIQNGMTTTFWYNENYDPQGNGNFIPRDDIPNFYIPNIIEVNGVLEYHYLIQLTNKQLYDSLKLKQTGISFDRNNNYLYGFLFLSGGGSDLSYINDYESTDYNSSNMVINSHGDFEIKFSNMLPAAQNIAIRTHNVGFKVNYIPMSDIKVKYDNSGIRNDTHLYNQNGKLTDSVAFSKLLLSYSKEIESNNITKYGTYYDLDDVPQVGTIVDINGEKYIINNVSLDFVPNEPSDIVNYYIVGEFTLSKNVAVKSLMTNPNTNIRDYGIPQTNNVVRKQLYRDFYELTHERESTSGDYLLPINKVLNVSNQVQDFVEHTAIIKVKYKSAIGGGGTAPDSSTVPASDTWYYQLETTTYVLKKSLYEVINFNDNNIIGYSSQNIITGFFIDRIISGLVANINTPISYVDDNGELESIYIAMCNQEQYNEVYNDYDVNFGNGQKPMENTFLCFIPKEIYEGDSNGSTTIYYGVISNLVIDQVTFDIDITDYLGDYDGGANELTFESVTTYDILGNVVTYSYMVEQRGDNYYLVFYNITGAAPVLCDIDTIYYDGGYIGAKEKNDFMISEVTYNKDSLEVPFFEYSCQIDDSNDVIVGENVLDTGVDTIGYIYSYKLVDKNKYNENNSYSLRNIPTTYLDGATRHITVDNGVSMECNNLALLISFGTLQDINMDTLEVSNGTSETITNTFKTKDILIFRHKIPNDIQYKLVGSVVQALTTDDLMFVIKNTKDMEITNNKIVLKVNHYKLS